MNKDFTKSSFEKDIQTLISCAESMEVAVSNLDELYAFRLADLQKKGFTRKEALQVIVQRGLA